MNSYEAFLIRANLGCLRVTGDEAATFLQGQLTGDVLKLEENCPLFTALCNAKGRVISTLFIVKQAHDFALLLPSVLVEKVQTTLKKYILRAKVRLNHEALPAELWEQVRLDAQKNHLYAWLDEKSSEQFIPQMLNVDKLGGVSFTKGCYTGQEVIARTHYLGQTKRELFLARATLFSEKADSFNGTAVLNAEGEKVGEVLAHHLNDFQIVLQISALDAVLTLENSEQLLLI